MLYILMILLMLLKPDHASVPVVGDDFDVVGVFDVVYIV